MALDLERSEKESIRQQVMDMMDNFVPKAGLSSDDPMFAVMTGWTTTSLREHWKNNPVGTKYALLTTCNAFVGRVARQLGAKGFLSRGILQLDLAAKDVPGCWVDADPTGEDRPSRGDFYAQNYVDKKGNVQKFAMSA